MYLKEIMSNYLNEDKKVFDVEKNFKPVKVDKSSWDFEEKRACKSFNFENRKYLEYFIVEVLKYLRDSDADIEVRFFRKKAGIIINALSSSISEIEIEASKDIDKIKKDVMYYHAK